MSGIVYERLLAGERDFGDEIVESFIKVGDFYLPDNDELRKTAEQIVSAFLKALLGGLLQGSGAIPVLVEPPRATPHPRSANTRI